MPVSAGDAAFVRELLQRRAAIQIDDTKEYLIEMRLEQLARDVGVEGIPDLVRQARAGTKNLDTRIVEAMTTHETSFFRDLHPFNLLKKEVLPALLTAREKTRSLTIWSAACSSGQEAYSISMLILEAFPDLAKWPIRIIGTDISEQIVARAREGKFRQMDVNRGLPATLLVKYFDKVGAEWQIKPIVRSLVDFRPMNLLGAWALPRPDVVFMRNVLIYFDQVSKRNILVKLRSMLPADGALFLGAAESATTIDEPWNRFYKDNAAYYRVRP
jgi:chemotaxis protein methyltransferase CheR